MRDDLMCPILPLPTTTTLARRGRPARRVVVEINIALRDPEKANERIPAEALANSIVGSCFFK